MHRSWICTRNIPSICSFKMLLRIQKMSCDTLEARQKANAATPCPKPFRSVFPEAIVGYVAPGVLILGTTLVGYGLGTGRKWAISGLVSPSTQLSIMLLLLVADHSSSFFDHSRISGEAYCLTSMLTSKTLDETKGRLMFGGLGALLTGLSVYGIVTSSITLASTSIPFAAMMYFLCWSPQTFQTCRNNSLVTGGLAFGLDIMTFVGILETLFLASGNTSTSWHNPTIAYSVVVSALFVVLVGWHSEYGQRIKPGSCAIEDEADKEAEKLVDRRGELLTGITFSITSIIYFLYLKQMYTEVSCCAVYPTLMFLGFDVLTKLALWKKGDPLVGNNIHRSVVYTMVQVLDVLLSSSSLVGVAAEKGLLADRPKSRGLLGHGVQFFGGSITYIWTILRLVFTIVSGGGNKVPTSSIKRLAEVIKTLSLNVAANLIPLVLDKKNSSYMLSSSPQNDLNVPCHVD